MLFTILVLAFNLLVPNNIFTICYEIREKVYYDLNSSESLFNEFLSEYNKHYTDEEYNYRLKVFEENLKKVNELNKEHDGTVFGITHLLDLTTEEFKSMASGVTMNVLVGDIEQVDLSQKYINLPDELDYRKQNLVTEVKDQSFCGSCYIFGAVGEVEGQYAKKHGSLISFSEQYVMDCSGARYQFGCGGGYPHDVMRFLATKQGALKFADYPYRGTEYMCTANSSLGVAKVKDVRVRQTDDIETIKKLLVEHGPLSIAFTAEYELMAYKQGVYKRKCTEYSYINHAVVLVGYGKDGEDEYWLIKNSWDKAWGEDGYLRLSMDSNCEIGSYIAISEVH